MKKVSDREWILGFIVILIAIGISVVFYNPNYDGIRDYQKSLLITDATEFQYSEKTLVGNVLAYGNTHGDSRVSFPELHDSYSYIRKVEEDYTQHSRQIPNTTCSGPVGNQSCTTTYRTEIYYTWDFNGADLRETQTYTFLGVKFDKSQINLPSPMRLNMDDKTVSDYYKKYIEYDYIYKENDSDIRWYFEYLPTDFNSTVFTGFFFNKPVHVDMYYETTPEQVISSKESYAHSMAILYYLSIILGTSACYFTVAYYFEL